MINDFLRMLFFPGVPILIIIGFPLIFINKYKFKLSIIIQGIYITFSVCYFLLIYSSLMFPYTHDKYGCGTGGHFFDIWAEFFAIWSMRLGLILLLLLLIEFIIYLYHKKRKKPMNK
jgi:hypothetical protein